MSAWFGIIKISEIGNKGNQSASIAELNVFCESHVKFVHYPDCQQMIIWLPRPGVEYSHARLHSVTTGKLVEKWPVDQKLSGAIQILWDTLPISPDEYRLEIEHVSGAVHFIGFIKHPEGVKIEEPPEGKKEPKETSNLPIEYKDGFGNIIVNEDLELRKKVLSDMARKFSRCIEYQSAGRAGTVIYNDNETRISFSYELGGGKCVAYIDIPGENEWEKATNTSLGRREEIISFLASAVQARQASNCRIEISNTAISFIKK